MAGDSKLSKFDIQFARSRLEPHDKWLVYIDLYDARAHAELVQTAGGWIIRDYRVPKTFGPFATLDAAKDAVTTLILMGEIGTLRD